jgi:hypothetical protein
VKLDDFLTNDLEPFIFNDSLAPTFDLTLSQSFFWPYLAQHDQGTSPLGEIPLLLAATFQSRFKNAIVKYHEHEGGGISG